MKTITFTSSRILQGLIYHATSHTTTRTVPFSIASVRWAAGRLEGFQPVKVEQRIWAKLTDYQRVKWLVRTSGITVTAERKTLKLVEHNGEQQCQH